MRTRVFLASVLLTTACGASSHTAARPAVRPTPVGVQAVAAAAAGTGSVAALGDGKTHSASAARALADAALDLITFPAGTTRLATRPVRGSTSVGTQTVIISQVTRTRWWSVPGTVADAAAWLIAHAPEGLTVTQPVPADLSWAGLPWFPMNGTLAQDGDDVDVSVSTEVVWIPNKTAIETIPSSVTSALLDFDGNQNAFGLDARRVLTGTALSKLRDSLNAYQPTWVGPSECPPGYGGLATVTLRYAGHDVVITTGGYQCNLLTVTSDGRSQPVLACCAPGTSSVDDTLTPLLPAHHSLASQRSLLADVTSVEATLAQDNRLLATLPLPPAAVREKPPHGSRVSFRDDLRLVDRTRWFTLPRTRTAALTWLTTHPAPGFTVAHIGTDYDKSTVLVEQPAGVYPSSVDLTITLSGRGSQTKAQVVARKYYLPTRSIGEAIPLRTRSAQLSYQPASGPTQRVQYHAADLSRLVRWLNSRPAQWYETPCTKARTTPAQTSKLGALFHVGVHTINFYWYGDSCDMIVVVDGKNAPYLTGPPTALVERLVRSSAK